MKTNLCGRFRYPATPEGRRKYIQDSLPPDSFRIYRLKELGYLILIWVTLGGLLVILFSLLF